MVGEEDERDKRESRRLAIVLVGLVGVLVIAAALMLPALSGIVSTHLTPGLGMKEAAVLAFFATIVIMIVFALAAGDGLLGEIQFMLAAFFLFFVILWLMLAWIF